MVGAALEDNGFVGVVAAKALLAEEEDPASGIGEDGDPPTAVGVVDGEFLGDVEAAADGAGDEVLVVAMGDAVDAAIEDMDAIVGLFGAAGEHEGVAVVESAVHPPGAATSKAPCTTRPEPSSITDA